MRSALLTLVIVVATIVGVYTLPARHHALATAAVSAHRQRGPVELDQPSPDQVRAYLRQVVGAPARLVDPLALLPVRSLRRTQVLGQPVVVVDLATPRAVTVLISRVVGLPPRRLVRRDVAASPEGPDVVVVAWRTGPWHLAAAGPADDVAAWRRAVGAP